MQLTRWVDYRDLKGNTDEDRLPDFSFAGYQESAVPLPTFRRGDIALQATNDDTDRTPEIQEALNRLKERNGGVLQFSGGTFTLSSEVIKLDFNNVHLMGETRRPTIFKILGPPRHVIEIGKADPGKPVVVNKVQVLDGYVPTGAKALTVENPDQFEGKTVIVEKTVTKQWLKEMGMDVLTRNGAPQVWLKQGSKLTQIRRVVSISKANKKIFLDIPLTDSAPGADFQVGLYTRPEGVVENIGISDIQMILRPSQSDYPIATPGAFLPLVFNSYVTIAYARNIYMDGFLSAVQVSPEANRITLSNCQAYRTVAPNRTKGYPSDFNIGGSQILLLRCGSSGVPGAKSFTVAVQSRLNLVAVVGQKDEQGTLQPHQRWATGVLFDCCKVATIEMTNRGNMGSGHGWCAGSSVVWNSKATLLKLSRPPTSQIFSVGNIADQVQCDGLQISPGQHVQPYGLFAQQLQQRIGKELADRVLEMAQG